MRKFKGELLCLECREPLTVKDWVNPRLGSKRPEICVKCKNKRR